MLGDIFDAVPNLYALLSANQKKEVSESWVKENRTVATASRSGWLGRIKRKKGYSEAFLNCGDLLAK